MHIMQPLQSTRNNCSIQSRALTFDPSGTRVAGNYPKKLQAIECGIVQSYLANIRLYHRQYYIQWLEVVSGNFQLPEYPTGQK